MLIFPLFCSQPDARGRCDARVARPLPETPLRPRRRRRRAGPSSSRPTTRPGGPPDTREYPSLFLILSLLQHGHDLVPHGGRVAPGVGGARHRLAAVVGGLVARPGSYGRPHRRLGDEGGDERHAEEEHRRQRQGGAHHR